MKMRGSIALVGVVALFAARAADARLASQTAAVRTGAAAAGPASRTAAIAVRAPPEKQVQVARGGAASGGVPLRGVLAVLGGVMVHLTLGTIYCFGNFISYLPKNLENVDGPAPEGSTPQALLVLPLTMMFQCMGLPIGSNLQKFIKPRFVALIGAWFMAFGVYLSSYANNLTMFMLTYSVMFGLGIGTAYTASWVEGWKWFPNRRGLVSGAVLTGFGAGGFFFNKIGSSLVNPEGLNPVNGVFADSVYGNWGKMLRTLAIIYAVMAGIGAFCIAPPSKEYQDAVAATGAKGGAGPVKSYTVKEALATKQWKLLWLCIFMSVCGSLNVSANYKYIATAKENLNSDSFLSLVGGVGALANGAGRLFWGSVADSYGFQKPGMVLTLIQALLFPVFMASTASKTTFALACVLSYFCLGGNFSIFPAVMPKIFGPENGAAIYAMIYSAFGTSAVSSFFLAKSLIKSYGWTAVFNGLSLMSMVAFTVAATFPPLKA